MRKKIWVGIKFRNEQALPPIMEVFRCADVPTETSHGHLYGAVTGPFRTARGAKFMAEFGDNNPHCRCVADAERLAKS